MRKINLLFLTAALAVCSFAQEPSVGIPAGGGLNLPAAARSKPTPRGTSLPGTCEVGETYFKTDAAAGQNLYGCTSTNTWTLLGDGGGAGGGDNISVNGTAASDADFDDSTPAAPANSINARWQKDGLTPNNVSANVPYASPLTVSGGNLTVASDSLAATYIDETANFSFTGTLFGPGALTCGAGAAGKALVHTTPLQYCDNAATPALQYAAYGDSGGNALSGDSATAFFSSGTVEAARLPNLENLNGALDLASGGTNQTTWTASRCVRVNDAGTALDVAAADCGSGGGNHNLLSATHPDTTAASPTRGDIVTAQGASPTWSRLAKGTQYQTLQGGATEPLYDAVHLDQSSAVSGILGSANGGTGNGFTKFTGPTTSEKIFTLPDASATIEVQSNKNAASGYAGLTASTKLTAAQGQEVWGLTDFSDVAITTPATAQTVRYNGSSWANAALACADVTNCPALVTSGTAGNGPSKVGDATTAARSNHDHRSIHTLTWYFPGTPSTGVQNLILVFPEVAVNFTILDMRVTAATTSSGSSTFNIQRCTASCTGASPTFANIYSTNLTLNASTSTTSKASAPDQNVTSLTAGDQFKANLVSIGASLADITLTMTYKYDTTN